MVPGLKELQVFTETAEQAKEALAKLISAIHSNRTQTGNEPLDARWDGDSNKWKSSLNDLVDVVTERSLEMIATSLDRSKRGR